MLWQSVTPSLSNLPKEEPAQTGKPEAPKNDAYDRLLDSRMVDEGCPNCREDD